MFRNLSNALNERKKPFENISIIYWKKKGFNIFGNELKRIIYELKNLVFKTTK